MRDKSDNKEARATGTYRDPEFDDIEYGRCSVCGGFVSNIDLDSKCPTCGNVVTWDIKEKANKK